MSSPPRLHRSPLPHLGISGLRHMPSSPSAPAHPSLNAICPPAHPPREGIHASAKVLAVARKNGVVELMNPLNGDTLAVVNTVGPAPNDGGAEGSLMSGVAAKSINVLFSYVKPAIKDNDSLIPKRAYKVLSMLLKS
ncbi:hypothetical protein Zm00014a_040721 [Zea mays]|uniref:Uncharacterized protein n=1 Tax=Zea mays TaxID=4577 RepID=A0A3L6FRK0_MAIZE|nr:hypothetical protein Zm00014a_040721 [Zea mays]